MPAALSAGLADALLFACGTALLVLLSRKALRHPRSHGFYRFFAWEMMLANGVLDRPDWGQAPGSMYQRVGQGLLLGSLALVLAALFALHRNGGHSRERSDDSLFEFEKTAWLVNDGVYRYIRHPMYASLLLLNWACYFEVPSLVGAALATVATLFLALTARADEQECLRYFGPGYGNYMKGTKRFIPLLF